MKIPHRLAFIVIPALVAAGCSDDKVSSDEEARRAYLGLDLSVDKAIDLGFKGFGAAKSANIDPQAASGDKGGTLTVGGKVDQGASSNKTMDLTVGMAKYSDDGKITYDTPADTAIQPKLSMLLKSFDMPGGDLTGTLMGDFDMSGDLKGKVTLNLSFTAKTEPDPTNKVKRTAGSTHITGSATSSAGTYKVDVTR